MSVKAIESYFASNLHRPFYMVVGDESYFEIQRRLLEMEIEPIMLSSCCRAKDKKPDLDLLEDKLQAVDVNCNSNRVFVLGLGEYLALEGAGTAYKILNQLKDFNLGSGKAVFLLRGVGETAKKLMKSDIRLQNRQIFIEDETKTSLNFAFSTVNLNIHKLSGFQDILREAEKGTGEICGNTALLFPDATIKVRRTESAYDALIRTVPRLSVQKSQGKDGLWSRLLKEIESKDNSLQKVFESYGFSEELEEDFHRNIKGEEYRGWLYYIYLLENRERFDNKYLQLILNESRDFDEFKNNILGKISQIPRTSSDFDAYYLARKKLIKGYMEAEMAIFVNDNRFDGAESVYRLTDNTRVEKQEIIAMISQWGLPEKIHMIYPALESYLKKYVFRDTGKDELLTEYFDKYKWQKIFNKIEPRFLEEVDRLAVVREYNYLCTREEILSKIEKDRSFLCWIDALGVEYFSYIDELARKYGLHAEIKAGCAQLPTITSQNRKFFDDWPEKDRYKKEELDEVKHKEKGGYKYGPDNLYPIHLARELEILDDVISEAAVVLGQHRYERYIIASDHGASRLAVLRRKEEKYETDTKGKHSGRCCKQFSGYDLPFATEENGYIVLADYGRFKGSRAANVEVHGGAALEEVIVPVITLTLKDSHICINLDRTNPIKADYKKGVEVILTVNQPIIQQMIIKYKGQPYEGEKVDENHYKVKIPAIKRANTYKADVYLGEKFITQIVIPVEGKTASVNTDFDNLF